MSFITPDGVAYTASIKDDGTYSISDVPAGELVVVVETESKKPKTTAAAGKDDAYRKSMQGRMVQSGPGSTTGGGGAPPPPKEVYTKIPDKYGKKETSPLTAKLSSGRNVFNVELTD